MTPKYQRELRASLAFLHDLVAVALTWLVSYSLRFNFSPSADGIEAMNKKLLAIALTGLALPLVAHAQTANVTLYGVVDEGYRWDKTNTVTVTAPNAKGVPTSVTTQGVTTSRIAGSIESGSRWGLRGTESLGGDTSAFFNLESGFQADTGSSTQGNANNGLTGGRLFGRRAVVGLNFGSTSVYLGREYSPEFNLLGDIDPFGTGMTGDASALFPVTVRIDNSANVKANFGPVATQLQWSTKNGGTDATNGDHNGRNFGGMVEGNFGPALVGLSYEDVRANSSGLVASHQKNLIVGAVLNLAVVKLHAGFDSYKQDNTKTRNYLVGLTAPVGATTLYASWVRKDDKSNGVTNHGKSDQLAIGADYAFSKRTNLYTSLSKIRNNDYASVTQGGCGNDCGLPIVNGQDPTSFALGIRHKF